jgi:hypothetical protein
MKIGDKVLVDSTYTGEIIAIRRDDLGVGLFYVNIHGRPALWTAREHELKVLAEKTQ